MYIHFICKNCKEVSTNNVNVNGYLNTDFMKLWAKVFCSECGAFSFVHVARHVFPIPKWSRDDSPSQHLYDDS